MERAVRPGCGRPSPASRSLLLVSPQFPPSSLVGAHRARHLAKHLGAHGWRPTVVTVRPEDYGEELDERLARLVPGHVEVLRVAAVPKGPARRIGIGDVGLRGFLGLRSAVMRCIAGRRPDLVLVTGFPFYPMLMAGSVRRRGVPVVLDFQDPWLSDRASGVPLLSKAGLSHRLAAILEPRAVRAASGIMSVSAVQNRAMQGRYPDLPADRWCDLPIGGDWEDFEAVPPPPDRAGRTLLYAGALLPRSAGVVAALFGAVARIRRADPRRLDGTRLRFVGTAAVTDRRALKVVTPIAEREGVADLVDEVPWRLPYLDALAEMRHAHANLLIGSDEPHYTASKIYPALMSGRPFLSIFREESSAHAILARSGGGIALGFGEGSPAPSGPALDEALGRILEGVDRLGAVDRALLEPFTAPEIARRCASFLDRIVAQEAW